MADNLSHVSFTEDSDLFAEDPPTVDDARYWATRAESAQNNAAASASNAASSADAAAQSAIEASEYEFDTTADWTMSGNWEFSQNVDFSRPVTIAQTLGSRPLSVRVENSIVDRPAIYLEDQAGVDRVSFNVGGPGGDYPNALVIAVDDDGTGLSEMVRIRKTGAVFSVWNDTLGDWEQPLLSSSDIDFSGNVSFANPVVGATPTLDSHLATKQYVDLNGGGGGGNFDPSLDQVITGVWAFTQDLTINQGLLLTGTAPDIVANNDLVVQSSSGAITLSSLTGIDLVGTSYLGLQNSDSAQQVQGGFVDDGVQNGLLFRNESGNTGFSIVPSVAGLTNSDVIRYRVSTSDWWINSNARIEDNLTVGGNLTVTGTISGIDLSLYLPKTAGATQKLSDLLQIDRALATGTAGNYLVFEDNGGVFASIQKRSTRSLGVMDDSGAYIAIFNQDNTTDFAGQIRARGAEGFRSIGSGSGNAFQNYVGLYDASASTMHGQIGFDSASDNQLRIRNEISEGGIELIASNSAGTPLRMISTDQDFTTVPRVALTYGGSNVLLTSDPGETNIISGVRIKDGNGIFRGAGFLESAKFSLTGTLTMSGTYAGHTIYISGGAGAAVIQFNFESVMPEGTWFNVVTGSNACSIKSNSGSVTVRWLQGGSLVDRGSGSSFTVAAGSMVTCWKFSDAFWFITGNGIS